MKPSVNRDLFNNPTKFVTTCARSRFYIFEQAYQLQKRNLLHKLVTDYPKSYPKKFNIDESNIESKILLGIIAHGFGCVAHMIKSNIKDNITKQISNFAGLTFANSIDEETKIMICMSTFAYESIMRSKQLGIISIVDQASLHKKTQISYIEKEKDSNDYQKPTPTISSWVLDKEDAEFKNADHIFCPSNLSKSTLIKQGVPEKKIFVNYLGVDVKKFYPDKHKKSNLEIQIGFVGQITLSKGILTILNAIKLINDKKFNFSFVGQRYNDEEFDKKIISYNLKNVSFLPPLNQQKLQKFYNKIDILVMPSVSDGFGLVVIEAMSCGIPVIVSDQCGAAEIVKDGSNGLIFEASNSSELAKKIIYLSENLEEYTYNSLKKSTILDKQLSWETYGDNLSKILIKILNEKGI